MVTNHSDLAGRCTDAITISIFHNRKDLEIPIYDLTNILSRFCPNHTLHYQRTNIKNGMNLIVIGVKDNIIDLENHADELSSELELLLLTNESLEHLLITHGLVALVEAINADVGIVGGDLSSLDISKGSDRGKTTVLSKSDGSSLKSLSESSDSVLLRTNDLLRSLLNLNRASNLARTTTVDDTVVADEVTSDAHGIVERSLGLLDSHVVTTAHENGDGLGVRAVLDQEHGVLLCTEGLLVDAAGSTELGGGELLEAGHDVSAGGEGEQLELDTADPTHGGKVVLEEKVVGLIVEAPLAEDDISTGVLAELDHVDEVLLLGLVESLEGLGRGDLESVLGLGLGGLEGAGQEGDLDVLVVLLHLGVGEVLAEHKTVHEHGVLKLGANLALHLDEVEVDVLALNISDSENSINGDLSHLALATVDDLGAESGHGSVDEARTILGPVHLLRDLLEVSDSEVAGSLITAGNGDGVDATLQQLASLLKERASEHSDTSGTITDFRVL